MAAEDVRVTPHSLDAERSVLGAVLLDRAALDAASAHVTAASFFRRAHQQIFAAMVALDERRQGIDFVTVREVLATNGELEDAGGQTYLAGLVDGVPRTTNVEHYAQIVAEKATLRALIAAGTQMIAEAYDHDDAAAVVTRAEARLAGLGRESSARDFVGAEDWMQAALQQIERNTVEQRVVSGIPTSLPALDRMLRGFQPSNLILIGARTGVGKALALNTPIPTPHGFSSIGDLHVGDSVIDANGYPCRVTYVSPIYIGNQCYQVTFNDGTTVVADADHQWFAYDHAAWKSHFQRVSRTKRAIKFPRLSRDQSKRHIHPRIVTTGQMLAEGVHVRKTVRKNWHIPISAPLCLPSVELPVDPYVFGCWLGAGTSSASSMTIGDQDASHFIEQFASAGYPLRKLATKYMFSTSPVPGTGKWQSYSGPLRHLALELRSIGLATKARLKHIPTVYMRSSVEQRLALLQGLMDTDGHAKKTGRGVEILMMNRSLMEQIRELVCSLGQLAPQLKEKVVTLAGGRTVSAWRLPWTPTIEVFRIPRKAIRARSAKGEKHVRRNAIRNVVSITEVPSVAVRCISVDSPSRLFLATQSMIPTHNTSLALQMCLEASRHTTAAFLSLEMSREELSYRAVALESQVDAFRLQTGEISARESEWVGAAAARIGERSLLITDTPQTIHGLCASVRRLAATQGLGIVFVDYLTLIEGPRSENRTQEVSAISRRLKALAMELQIPVVALAQLSREVVKGNAAPELHHLRESGSLEQDANVVIFIHRPQMSDDGDTRYADGEEAHILVRKNRSGRTGRVTAQWRAALTKFVEQTPAVDGPRQERLA